MRGAVGGQEEDVDRARPAQCLIIAARADRELRASIPIQITDRREYELKVKDEVQRKELK